MTVLLTSNIAAVEINPWLAAGIIIAFIAARAIAKMAEVGDKGLYDDRNESAVKMAQKIRDAIGDDVLPYI